MIGIAQGHELTLEVGFEMAGGKIGSQAESRGVLWSAAVPVR
jgi:hypothetical protein